MKLTFCYSVLTIIVSCLIGCSGDSQQSKVSNPLLREPQSNSSDIMQNDPALAVDVEVPAQIITNSLEMTLVLLPSGEFRRGLTDADCGSVVKFDSSMVNYANFPFSQPQRVVHISIPFYLGVHEVTVRQFRSFVQETLYITEAELPQSEFGGGEGWDQAAGKFKHNVTYAWHNPGFAQEDDHPVVNVTWNDAVAFCEWLSRKEGKRYRLPTEAEWEYACRADSTTLYSHGNDPEALAQTENTLDATAKEQWSAWFCINGRDGYVFTASVGRFQANRWGLCDMQGNVSEWCHDRFDGGYYAISPLVDPQGPEEMPNRVVRGGSFKQTPGRCIAGLRHSWPSSGQECDLGFRLVQVFEQRSADK